jgi:hypothetical protein
MSERDLSTRDIAGTSPTEDEPTARERGDLHAETESSTASSAEATTAEASREPLLPETASQGFVERWTDIQTSFVDEPQQAVHQADELVAELMQQLARSFSGARERLEAQWASGDDASTEDLRIALQRYRSFFDRLLSA